MLPVDVVQQLMTALANKDTAVLNSVLPANAYLQVRTHGRTQIYWTRSRVRSALLAEFARWHNPTVKISQVSTHFATVTVTFQLEVTENGRLITHNHFATIIPDKGQIQTIILYYDHPVAAADSAARTLNFPSTHASIHGLAGVLLCNNQDYRYLNS